MYDLRLEVRAEVYGEYRVPRTPIIDAYADLAVLAVANIGPVPLLPIYIRMTLSGSSFWPLSQAMFSAQ